MSWRKIIYMGYVPPGARTEELSHVPSNHLKGIRCEEIQVNSKNKVTLSGNAGNPLARLPVFQRLLRSSTSSYSETSNLPKKRIAFVSVAPRSYWKSSPRSPTQEGLLTDYLHVLKDTLDRFPNSELILYGHSLGGAIAVCLLARLSESATAHSEGCRNQRDPRYARIRGLVLENPFASIPRMVQALYPERWVPYRYLAPLAWDKWDAVAAMRNAARNDVQSVLARIVQSGDILVMLSEKDEVVPKAMGEEIWDVSACANTNGRGKKVVVEEALHENAWEQRQWVREMRKFIAEAVVAMKIDVDQSSTELRTEIFFELHAYS
ncbi:hypothetical protein SERLA73DRAFT_156044 [Serpula lacrymans var. lacrymans S7.3]|uniref:AB hydrolase-1 domain-containing protein n=1 Tax=Serpula lacrymans var. lacrymans (strain S7.3) TaxID=936435 RepID=F8QCN6_SERL3|nr:hypothetical protein SERLA73DRAFT_156044 [Serpula lacrymans var. lacrymans S7.3]